MKFLSIIEGDYYKNNKYNEVAADLPVSIYNNNINNNNNNNNTDNNNNISLIKDYANDYQNLLEILLVFGNLTDKTTFQNYINNIMLPYDTVDYYDTCYRNV